MQEFILSKGAYHKDGHMYGFTDLWHWTNEGQTRLQQINVKFNNVWNLE
jgi:hypothetical protein